MAEEVLSHAEYRAQLGRKPDERLDAHRRAILRNLDRLSEAERRRWMRQERAEALRTVKAATAAGMAMRAVTIAGATYELGEPDAPLTPSFDINPWDRVYETDQKRPS